MAMLVTRPPSPRHVTPSQEQQAVPGFHEESFPKGSALMPALNPKRPDSSSGWQAAEKASLALLQRRYMKNKKRRGSGDKITSLCQWVG
ncbi:hypothetical protein SAY86_015527 [Trapa natans]|uniref:Uncharacterized protein n=1 Tax=Trapa natans TaxID=22666 RepID=A0AAN7LAL7_TRANT|nr:hypothetical protein SAY86_015527 [Trapa natans]